MKVFSDCSGFVKFSDFIGKTDDEIKNSRFYIIYIDDEQLFYDNIDLFIKVLDLGWYSDICSKDIKVLETIDSLLSIQKKPNFNFYLSLMDDFKLMDRSYIDQSKFTNSTLVVPLTYTLWNFDMKGEQKVAYCFDKNRFSPYFCNGLFYL